MRELCGHGNVRALINVNFPVVIVYTSFNERFPGGEMHIKGTGTALCCLLQSHLESTVISKLKVSSE